MDRYDPVTRRQIREFHQHLDAMSTVYKKAIVLIAADRLMRDLDRPVATRRWQALARLGRWIRERFPRKEKQGDDARMVIEINPDEKRDS